MSALVLAAILVPLVTAGVVLALGHRAHGRAGGVAVAGQAVGLLVAVLVALPRLGDAAPLTRSFVSTDAVGEPISLAVHVDPLAAVVLLLSAAVALLVQVYSLGYLAGDSRYPSYAALVALFSAAMATVVLADDLWVLLVGWELMGACSYFLISHHWELDDARTGAVKAFLVTRTADLGLLFAILLLGERFGTYRLSGVLAGIAAEAPARDELWLPAVLVAVAVAGKSAQVPFHTWLPDAMPGPTPVSALIHAATMVAAGVFLVARMYPLFVSAPAALTLLALTAAVTMLLAAVHALGSHDLKRVLAWSTVSQLAYMFGALAAGAWSAGVLHLLAHGAFKALLFLGAGSVMHAVGTTSLERMGGLRRALPHTFVAMTLGFGALAGVVPLVGFFTKDAVIVGALEQAREGRLVWPWVAWLLVGSMVVTALLTTAYALRTWLLVFWGPAPSDDPAFAGGPAVDLHEGPWSMRLPLWLLAVPTLLGGVAVVTPGALLGPAYGDSLVHVAESVVLTALVLLTAVLVLLRWRRCGRELWPSALGRMVGVDRLVDAAVVRPVGVSARLVRAGERDVVEAYADGAAATASGLGRLLGLTQTSRVQTYVLVVVVGAAAVAVAAGVAA